MQIRPAAMTKRHGGVPRASCVHHPTGLARREREGAKGAKGRRVVGQRTKAVHRWARSGESKFEFEVEASEYAVQTRPRESQRWRASVLYTPASCKQRPAGGTTTNNDGRRLSSPAHVGRVFRDHCVPCLFLPGRSQRKSNAASRAWAGRPCSPSVSRLFAPTLSCFARSHHHSKSKVIDDTVCASCPRERKNKNKKKKEKERRRKRKNKNNKIIIKKKGKKAVFPIA